MHVLELSVEDRGGIESEELSFLQSFLFTFQGQHQIDLFVTAAGLYSCHIAAILKMNVFFLSLKQ